MPDPLQVYEISFDSTSDWFRAVILDAEGEWLLPPRGTLDVKCGDDRTKATVYAVHVDAKSAGIEKVAYDTAKTTMHLYVQTTLPTLTVKTGHGNVLGPPGQQADGVTIISPIERKTNNEINNGVDNYVTYALRLK
jgi:hypothetical protein